MSRIASIQLPTPTTKPALFFTLLLSLLVIASTAKAQDYGPDVTLGQARTVIMAAEAEAKERDFNVAIAVVDTAGNLVAFIKRDNTQTASVQVAQDKAITAALYKRSSKTFQDTVASDGGGPGLMSLHRVTAVEGGLPLEVDGKIIGAVGVSGVASDDDAIVAEAGVNALQD